MKPAAFDYHAPTDAGEAVALLSDLGEDAKIIAGGQSLVPMLALRLSVPEHLVDLRRIGGLRGIERRDGVLRIGACTTQAMIERSAEVARDVPLLARATPLIGHFQIRNRGTIGGSLAHADAAAEYPAVALALGARIHARSPRGERTVPADEFFTGMWTTELAEDELLTAVDFPVRDGRGGFAVEEFAPPRRGLRDRGRRRRRRTRRRRCGPPLRHRPVRARLDTAARRRGGGRRHRNRRRRHRRRRRRAHRRRRAGHGPGRPARVRRSPQERRGRRGDARWRRAVQEAAHA
nr:FAD binding domain-containing protein [Actinomadura sp. CNU-125]